MPSTRSLLVAVALGAGALTTLSALPAGAATSSAQSQVTAALAAANSQKTVHYVATSTYSTRSIVITGDVSATEGQQQVVLHYGKNVGHMTNLLVGSAVYFKGDAYGLTAYLGLPSSLAPTYAGKWISVTSSSQGYSSIAQSLTLSSAVDQISIKGPYKQASVSTGGQKATALVGLTSSLSTGKKVGPATLFLTQATTPLPIRFVGIGHQSKGTAHGQVSHSNWNEPLNFTAPTGAIPASSISAAAG